MPYPYAAPSQPIAAATRRFAAPSGPEEWPVSTSWGQQTSGSLSDMQPPFNRPGSASWVYSSAGVGGGGGGLLQPSSSWGQATPFESMPQPSSSWKQPMGMVGSHNTGGWGGSTGGGGGGSWVPGTPVTVWDGERPQGSVSDTAGNGSITAGDGAPGQRPVLESVGEGRWKIGEQLGAGSFGEVHAGVEVATGAHVAVKRELRDGPRPQLDHECKTTRKIFL